MCTRDHIRESLQGLMRYYTQNPDKEVGPDKGGSGSPSVAQCK